MVALIISVVAFVMFMLVSKMPSITVLWIILTIAAVIMPPVSKYLRMKKHKKGKCLEIIAIILGGFDFWNIIYTNVNISLYVGYLGWIFAVVAYVLIKDKNTANSTNTKDNAE